jgi:hypothetical protein
VDRLTSLQVGRYAEYFVKMQFVLLGCDVYAAEVDERGIDFVLRRGPGEMVRQKIFKDAVPWIVIRVFGKPLPDAAA